MSLSKKIRLLLLLPLLTACAWLNIPGTRQPNPNSALLGTMVAQTLTAYAPVPTQTVPPPIQTPQEFIANYFDSINSRNYTLTWSRLSDRFKDLLNGSSQDGYQAYTDFWNSVSQAKVLEVDPACQGEVCAVNVTLQLDYANGQSDTSIYPYTLTYDHTRDTWLFDLLPTPTATPAILIPATIPPTLVPATVPPTLKRPKYTPGERVDYMVQTGDTLPALAAHFNTTTAEIMTANPQIRMDATTLLPGMPMKIPINYLPFWGTQLQIMPDSLFVEGPSVNGFNTSVFVSSQPGWLKDYREDVGAVNRSAAELIDIVATNFSISPRALLVLIEYQMGALSQPGPASADYPLGHVDENSVELYRKLVYAGNILNAGYYGWRTGGLTQLVFPDYTIERPDPWQNAATVAFQYYYSLNSQGEYARATGPDGLRRVAFALFGDPWAANENQPHIPADLRQPALILPFPAGYTWSFTGGPHSAWGEAALRPWAALDFAPLVHECDAPEVPVVAMADGVVARSEAGIVMEDLDGDGNERTGWNILYLHIAGAGEARLGQRLKQGDPIGLASCEGGATTGTHVHIARKYNGEWIPADSAIPFNLEGWIAHTSGTYYQGTLVRSDRTVTASSYGNSASLIQAGQ